MKHIYLWGLLCLGILLAPPLMGQPFSHKKDSLFTEVRSQSGSEKIIAFTDLFTYPGGWTGKEKIQDSASVSISFVSTDESKLKFDRYYYSEYLGQYFYFKIPTGGVYGRDTLTVSITYDGVTAQSRLIVNVRPVACRDDAYAIQPGETAEWNAIGNDSPSNYFYKNTLQVVNAPALGTATITDSYRIKYTAAPDAPNYSRDTLTYRLGDSEGNYDTATVAILIRNNPYVTKVFEYLPAPGQFVNTSAWGMRATANNLIANTGGGVSLGGFGGYIVVGFDQPIVNRPDNPYGVDFSIKGNAFGGWGEPAAVQVMKDENGNGLPDDTWYELAGSDYHFSSSVKNLTMTYYNPKYTKRATIPYSTDRGFSGAMRTNGFHNQPYYPDPFDFGISKDSVFFTGTFTRFLLDKSQSGYILARRLPLFGYADVKPNQPDLTVPVNPYGSNGNCFCLEWAVDANGNHVELDTVHFVKVYNTVQEDGGWLGEISPEVFSVGITTPDPSYVPTDHYAHAIGAGQLQVLKGRSFQFEGILFKNGMPQGGTASWESTNGAVGTVDNTGLFLAKELGETTIKFQVNPSVERDSVTIDVVELTRVTIELEGNTASPDSVEIYKGSSLSIVALAEDNRPSPSNKFAYETYLWTSSSPEVGTVDNGLFRAMAVGKTKVIAQSEHYPTLADTIKVIVKAIPELEVLADTVTIAYDKRKGTLKSTDLFATEGAATIFLDSVKCAAGGVSLSIRQNELHYELPVGRFGCIPLTFYIESYSQSHTKTVVLNALRPATDKSIVFVNGGEFMNPNNPTMLMQHTLTTGKTDTLDACIAGATSVQDMLVEGNFAYVSADYYITRYSLATGMAVDSVYTQDKSPTEADGTGTDGAGVNHKMAIYENLLLVTRQNSSAAPQDGYNVRVYNKGDLSLVKKIAVSNQATDIVLIGDSAYVMINGGFAGTTSSMAIIDLKTLTLKREVNLGQDGLGVMQMVVKDSVIYAIRLASALGAFGSGIVTYNAKTGGVGKHEFAAGIPYDSSPLAIEPLFGDTIFVKKELGYVAFNTRDNTFGSNKFFGIPPHYTQDLDHIAKGSAYDPEDGKFYVAYAYWHGTGVGEIYDAATMSSAGSFGGVGPSPEVLKVAKVYKTNSLPSALGAELIYKVGEAEEFEITLPGNLFSDAEDVSPDVFLFNPLQYSWLKYDRAARTLSGHYNQQLSDTVVAPVVLQAFDLQGEFIVDTITLKVCPVDDPPYATGFIADMQDYEGANGRTVELSGLFADPDNGVFTYRVLVNSAPGVASASITGTQLRIGFTAAGQTNITVQAESGGKTASLSFVVGVYPRIESPYAVANFEDLPLAPESYWDGSDNSGGFSSGPARFANAHSGAGWSGWSYSNRSDVTTPGWSNQFSAITGAGFDTTASSGKNYGVAYVNVDWISGGGSTIPLPLKFKEDSAYQVKGFYVTNSTYAALSMLRGDAFAKKFGGADGNDPDFLKLNIWGVRNGTPTDTIEFYLADFRFGDNTKDYVVKTWQWVELSGLGKVDSLMFGMESSDVGSWGINTPTYFNMDNLYTAPDAAPVLASPIADVTVVTNAPDTLISLVNVFADSDDDDAAITKRVLSNSNESIVLARIAGNNLALSFVPNAIGQSEIAIEGLSNGKAVTDTFTVTIIPGTGIDNLPIADMILCPNPTNGVFWVETNLNAPCTVRLYSMGGQMVYFNENYAARREIDISNQPAGQYVLSVKHGDSAKTLLVVKY